MLRSPAPFLEIDTKTGKTENIIQEWQDYFENAEKSYSTVYLFAQNRNQPILPLEQRLDNHVLEQK